MSGKKGAPKNRSGWIMLGIVAAAYAVLFAVDADAGRKALAKSRETLKMIAPVILIVLVLTALLGTWVNPRKFSKHLGEESGVKGWFLALTAGIVSHGSSYVWYPLLADLMKHGVRAGLVVAFLYARAVKIPWLPLMASYFGLGFTVLLTLYTVLGAWVQGMIADRILGSGTGT